MNGLLVASFPQIGERMDAAYYNLFRAQTAENPTDVGDLGPLDSLQRPWDPATITDPMLRAEVWQWLDEVVGWINREYAWDTSDLIPACWPLHPHLVHDLGVVADQRRRAGMAFTSDALEEWHRYCLAMFLDRMKSRYRGFCEDGHQNAPGSARNTRYDSAPAKGDRNDLFAGDIAVVLQTAGTTQQPLARPRFQVIDGTLIDTETGEIVDEPDR